MTAVFLKLVSMSITAGWIVLVLILLRLLAKRMPKWLLCGMWALVAIRLLCPVSLESVLSLIPPKQTVTVDLTTTERAPVVISGVDALNHAVNPIREEMFSPGTAEPTIPAPTLADWLTVAWIVGMTCMALYAVISSLRVLYRVRESVEEETNVHLCDGVSSPFIFGILRPRIYLPSDLPEEDKACVLAHERSHLARGDHLWKPLGFLLLSIYWFHPVLWVAYVLLCRDIEMACDERVAENLDTAGKKRYAEALLRCSMPRKWITACPLAFGEVGVGRRIRSILHDKKPAFWVIVVSVILCAVLAVCLLTDPLSTKPSEEMENFLHETILWHNAGSQTEGHVAVEDHEILAIREDGDRVTVYAWVLYREYSAASLTKESGSHTLHVFTAEKTGQTYRLLWIWQPRDGSYYRDDLRKMLPLWMYLTETDPTKYYPEQNRRCEEKARAIFAEGFQGMVLPEGFDCIHPPLTLEKVIELSRKGDDLTWADFEENHYVNTGSGLYIRQYEVGSEYELLIGGTITEGKPMYIYLCRVDDRDTYIDIRYDDVEAYLAEFDESKESSDRDQLLTFEKVMALSAKGEDLTWTDFENYHYVNIVDSDDRKIRRYEVNDGFELFIDERGTAEKPGCMILLRKGEKGIEDIRNLASATYAEWELIEMATGYCVSDNVKMTDLIRMAWDAAEPTGVTEGKDFASMSMGLTPGVLEGTVNVSFRNTNGGVFNVPLVQRADGTYTPEDGKRWWWEYHVKAEGADSVETTEAETESEITVVDEFTDGWENGDLILYGKPLKWYLDIAWEKASQQADDMGLKLSKESVVIRHFHHTEMVNVSFQTGEGFGWCFDVGFSMMEEDPKVNDEVSGGWNNASETVEYALYKMLAEYEQMEPRSLDKIGSLSGYELLFTMRSEEILTYIFHTFLDGGQTGTLGELMQRVMVDRLYEDERIAYDAENGQDYFDKWLAAAESAAEQHDDAWMAEHMPGAYLALRLQAEH